MLKLLVIDQLLNTYFDTAATWQSQLTAVSIIFYEIFSLIFYIGGNTQVGIKQLPECNFGSANSSYAYTNDFIIFTTLA